MRCPKCHYISYDSSARCRNCGYEFSFATDAPDVELPIQTGDEPLGPLGDFPLADPRARADTPTPSQPPAPARPSRTPRSVAPPRRSRQDLPLFKDRPDVEAPLVAAVATPRAPLAVRRATPIPPRSMGRTADDTAARRDEGIAREHVVDPAPPDDAARPASRAGAGRRAAAALIDAAVLSAIDAGVVYFTLQICGFSLLEIFLLPPVPLVTFLLLLDGGYLAAFTAAGGQTLGKMAAGIRVVSAVADHRVSVRDAVVRSAGYLVSALPVGLGFLPALFAADGRAVHDRLADTRVIRA